MKIQAYESKYVPVAQSGLAHAIGGERRGPLKVPKIQTLPSQLGAAGSLFALTNQIIEAQRVQEYSTAIVAARDGLATIQEGAQVDQALISSGGIEEHDRYYAEKSAALKESIIAGMRDPKAKKAFSARFDDAAQVTKHSIRDLGRRRIVDRGRASTDSELSALEDTIVRTGDLEALADADSIVDGKVAAGFFTAQEGAQLKRRFRHDSVLGFWQRKINEDASLVVDMLAQEPKSLKYLSENEITQLKARAESEAKKQMIDKTETRIYAELKAKFPGANQKAIQYLENAENYKELDLRSRNYLISTFEAEIGRDRHQAQIIRTETARQELNQAYQLLDDGDMAGAARLINKSDSIEPSKKLSFMEAIKKLPWKTDENLYKQKRLEIYSTPDMDPMSIDILRGHGLSNTDANQLINELEQKKKIYDKTVRFFEEAFKKVYPAKDNLDMHLRYRDAGNLVLDDMLAREREKGRPLTNAEQMEVAKNALESIPIERDFLWDIEMPEIEARLLGKGPWDPKKNKEIIKKATIINESMRKEIDNIVPRKIQDRIAAILKADDRPVTSETIINFYNNNKGLIREALRPEELTQ